MQKSKTGKRLNTANSEDFLADIYIPHENIKQEIIDSLDENTAWTNSSWTEKTNLMKK